MPTSNQNAPEEQEPKHCNRRHCKQTSMYYKLAGPSPEIRTCKCGCANCRYPRAHAKEKRRK